MIIWGKVVGAILGLALYGPVGIILGLVFGQIFDNGFRSVMRMPSHTAEVRMVFFKTVFQIMGYVSKADGVVSENEIQVARDVMLNYFNLNKRQTLVAINYFNEGKSANFNATAALRKFSAVCGRYKDLRKYFLEILVKTAMADNILRESQRGRLVYICGRLGIQLAELDEQLNFYGYNPYQHQHQQQQWQSQQQKRSNYNYNYQSTQQNDNLAAAYRLLGVSATDNIKTIKSAYRKMVSKYHPDKLVAKGLPPEMMEIAKEKTQQITVAYDLIVRSRG